MTAVVVVVAVGFGTYLLRASMFALVTVTSLPVQVTRALGLVGPAAVAALVATRCLTSDGVVAPMPPAELAAIAVGFLAVRRTGNVLHAFVAGMPVFWLLTHLAA